MDPNTLNTTPSFDLPMPTAEQVSNPNAATQPRPEQAPGSEAGRGELPLSGGPQQPAAVPGAQAAATNAMASAVPNGAVSVNQSAATSPLAADDVDLIEKEWVSKAKAIVDKTKYDPREQNKEINKIKADYIKKRYNRDIKVSEE